MTRPASSRATLLVAGLLAPFLGFGARVATPAEVAPRPAIVPDTVLYGAAYYHEYMPYDRLDKDIELMKRAGITVVRVGESTWTSWEPREGEFQFAWMDRIVDAMHAAGIKVVMGTPTYSIPPWLYAKHPEVMVMPLGQVRPPREFYGMRQNMDITHPVYRQYCERVIRRIAERYAKHPGVIGWEIDNETGAYGTAGPNVPHPWVSGFTTNPTLFKQAGVEDPWAHAKQIVALTGKPISIDGPHEVWDLGPNVYRKVIGPQPGKVARFNYTAVCTVGQARELNPHPRAIVSVFAGRIMDTGRDPQPVIDAAKATGAQVLWASVREPYNIVQAEMSGCDTVTVPPAILSKWLAWNRKPLEVVAAETVAQFAEDATWS